MRIITSQQANCCRRLNGVPQTVTLHKAPAQKSELKAAQSTYWHMSTGSGQEVKGSELGLNEAAGAVAPSRYRRDCPQKLIQASRGERTDADPASRWSLRRSFPRGTVGLVPRPRGRAKSSITLHQRGCHDAQILKFRLGRESFHVNNYQNPLTVLIDQGRPARFYYAASASSTPHLPDEGAVPRWSMTLVLALGNRASWTSSKIRISRGRALATLPAEKPPDGRPRRPTNDPRDARRVLCRRPFPRAIRCGCT